jgi:DNA-binding CsgD family transcriptional regulator
MSFGGKLTGPRPSRAKAARRGGPSLTALIAAMEAIGAPVLIVDTRGEVLHANSNGRPLVARDRRGISQSFARSVAAGGPNERGWELIPLSGQNGSPRFLAILSGVPRAVAPVVAAAVAPVVCVESARTRWKLTARQTQVLDLLAGGLTNATIAECLHIGVGTVEFHIAKIFDKAGVDNRATLIARLHDL